MTNERSLDMHPHRPSPPPPRARYVRGLAAGVLALLAATAPLRAADEWTTEDIIDNRIDVDAQYALMRMMSPRDLTHHLAGSAILSAVKDGDIGGVYQADRGVPAQRAQAAGSGWWQIVPKGFDATCYKAGSGAPIIVYRKGVGGVRERLDPALRSAWASCGLNPAKPKPYRVTLHKPPPPPKPTPPGTDPPPAAGLTVHVINSAGAPVPGATVDTIDANGGGTADTSASGHATFPEVPEGAVTITVTGPSNCSDGFDEVTMGKDPLTVEFTLECNVPAPPQPPKCDPDKYTEVFDPCGRQIWQGAKDCTLGASADYFKCGLDPVCAAEAMVKFWQCKEELDHKRKIQDCNDKANAASNCNYKGPLD
jgi:carboxypeptidase family protein